MAAEIVPLFKAVKNDDVNIENPANKKHNEQILIAVADNSFKSAFPLEKKLENVEAVNKLIVIIIIPVIKMIIKLFFNIFLNSL